MTFKSHNNISSLVLCFIKSIICYFKYILCRSTLAKLGYRNVIGATTRSTHDMDTAVAAANLRCSAKLSYYIYRHKDLFIFVFSNVKEFYPNFFVRNPPEVYKTLANISRIDHSVSERMFC